MWDENVGGQWGVFGHVYDETAGWDAASTTIDTPTSSSYLSAAGSNGSGYAVVWNTSPTGMADDKQTYASVYESDAWTATLLQTNNNDGEFIASNGSGYAVTWRDITGGLAMGAIYARIFDGGVWQDTVRLDTGDAATPRIASNGTGYTAVWGSHPTIYANVFNGIGWSGQQAIGTTTVSVSVKLAANDQGYLAYWRQDDLDGDSLFGSIHNGTQWQASPTHLGKNVSAEGVVGNGNGYAMVWREKVSATHDDLGYRIFNGTAWQTKELLENSNATLPVFFYLDVIKDGAGYAALWAQAHDGYGDPAVKKVWYRNFGQ